MSMTNIALIATAVVLCGLFFHPKLTGAPMWRATVTPLASIIGSGFLVVGPILADVAGTQAWIAMLALCGIAYLFGSAIRHNIAHVEPCLAKHPPTQVAVLERASELALSLAYFVSVAYYLNLFAAFGLRIIGVIDPFWIRIASSTVIACIGILGLMGGLLALERLTVRAVGLKLALIGGLLVALLIANATALSTGSLDWPELNHPRGIRELSVLLGLVILVQGFETSRYLGSVYDSATRIRTMRWAQWLSTGIYLSFILLITPYFTSKLPPHGGETAIIDMLRPIGMAMAPVVIMAALASQLSAAVADMNGASGLLSETFERRFGPNLGNGVTALVAIAITWSANIYEIITYASKVFVAYYGIQSLQATLSAIRSKRPALALTYATAALIALIVFIFATPAEA